MSVTPKILVAMSGGVDSSVAAALLLKQGYEVTGMYAVNYDTANDTNGPPAGGPTNSTNEGCWVPDYRDAVRVAAKLGIPLLRWDFTKEYKKFVLDYMYKEYSAGRTPNPDVLCNKFVKFGVWLEKAKKLGFTKLATGHYARLKLQVTRYKLQVSKDDNKDQTYFLHQLNQKQLSQVLFPLGDYTKPEVRRLAKKFALPTAEKEESMGICFIGEVPMKEFLQTRITQKKGKITLSDGTIVGGHDGLGFYTIGQRIGLRCHPERPKGVEGSLSNASDSASKRDSSTSRSLSRVQSRDSGRNDNPPVFVVDKDIKKNQLIVGYENDPLLYKKQINVIDTHWISGTASKMPLKCEVRLRHRQEMQNAECRMQNKKFVIDFDKPQRAPTPGQFAVIYVKGECLGGGVIA